MLTFKMIVILMVWSGLQVLVLFKLILLEKKVSVSAASCPSDRKW